MKIFLVITFLISLGYNEVALASEHHEADLIVINENSFVKVNKESDELETVQLFKIEGNKINLVDAILVDKKKVNLKPSYEYHRLKIEIK